jgi:uncharacterized protein YwgA
MIGKFAWLAAVIAAHPEHKVVGRTRLQKTVKLLQRLGAPLDYDYMIHFYGPYSEAVQADIGLLERLKLVDETSHTATDGSTYYVLEARGDALKWAESETMAPFRKPIEVMNAADPVVLELAATYDAFREMGNNHETALTRLRRKKGTKCEGGREKAALKLLKTLGLPND